MQVIKPPEKLINIKKSVFLAGSIEQNKAINWQKYIEDNLKNREITILNPRRDNWNADWKQDINNENFKEQVVWELEALELANLIIMYFDPKSKSPISLLELGLYAKSGKLIVCCPSGFWRKGNVDIVCEKYNIPQRNNLDELITYIIRHIKTNN